MKLRSFIKRFKRVINLVSVLSNTSDYFLWIQAYLKLFIHSVLLGKIYILLTYLVFNVQFLFSQALAYCFIFKKIKCSFTKVNSALIFLNALSDNRFL